MSSIFNPSVAKKYFLKEMSNKNSCWRKTVLNAEVKAFLEFNNTRYHIHFILLHFHKHFDGLIGLNCTGNMNFSNDWQKCGFQRYAIHFNPSRRKYTIPVNRRIIICYSSSIKPRDHCTLSELPVPYASRIWGPLHPSIRSASAFQS